MLTALGHHVEEAGPQFDYPGFLAAQKVIWAADSATELSAIAVGMRREINADTLLGDMQLLPFETGSSIGHAVGASEMTVTRFVRALGSEGLRARMSELSVLSASSSAEPICDARTEVIKSIVKAI